VSVTTNVNRGSPVLQVDFTVPPDCVLYAEKLHWELANGTPLAPLSMPPPALRLDKNSGHEKNLYDHDFTVLLAPISGNLVVKFQGCTNAACYFPEKRFFTRAADGAFSEFIPAQEASAGADTLTAASAEWQSAAADFHVAARETGYLSPAEFMAFLNRSTQGNAPLAEDPLGKLKQFGSLATLLLVLIGGLGLNLTPCVLPLIPINLAIIGAGRTARSRREGLLHGTAYGLGMSLTYGILGLAVVLTGAKFGTVNSSPWFNLVIALIFFCMTLAMFDVWHIDFNRFDRLLGRRESLLARQSGSKSLVAFSLGSVAALLAGACVAPVVISVMLMASALHARGNALGLALPFVLGLGMALPWPFLGASLSFLPKPGKWMNWVKYVFGVAIVVFALYYANLARGLFHSRQGQTDLAAAPGSAVPAQGANRVLADALQAAHVSGKMVFVDFAASWCKNCEAMDLTVFNQSSVQQRLKDFVVVKYQAESPNTPPAREVLDHFGVMGLPTYLVLSSK